MVVTFLMIKRAINFSFMLQPNRKNKKKRKKKEQKKNKKKPSKQQQQQQKKQNKKKQKKKTIRSITKTFRGQRLMSTEFKGFSLDSICSLSH